MDGRGRTSEPETGVGIEPVAVGLGQFNNDVLGVWSRRREIGYDGCLLVRPDRIIAWRCPRGVSDPAGALREAVTKILAVDRSTSQLNGDNS